MARTLPELVLPFLQGVESSLFSTVTIFRSPLHHEMVCGLDTLALPVPPDGEAGLIPKAAAPRMPGVWAALLPDPATGGSSVLIASRARFGKTTGGRPTNSSSTAQTHHVFLCLRYVLSSFVCLSSPLPRAPCPT